MRNMKMKKILVVISILILILAGILWGCFFNIEENKKEAVKEKSDNIYSHMKTYIEENKESIKSEFANRQGLLKNGEVFIGTTTRELENGYFDIKISLKQKYLELSVIKLWKDYTSEYLYEEKYIEELSNCIMKICKDKYTEDDIAKLNKYIFISYVESKKENIEVEDANISNIKIDSEIIDGILTMKIS